MQIVVRLDVVPGELVTNIITGIEMLRSLTDIWFGPLIFHLFQSSSCTSSVS